MNFSFLSHGKEKKNSSVYIPQPRKYIDSVCKTVIELQANLTQHYFVIGTIQSYGNLSQNIKNT